MLRRWLASAASHGGWKVLEFCVNHDLPHRWCRWFEPAVAWLNGAESCEVSCDDSKA